MRRLIAILLMGIFILGACGPKPMYKTKAGKKKLKHYNALQFGDKR